MKIVFFCNKDYNKTPVFQKIHYVTSICKDALFKRMKFKVYKEDNDYFLVYKVKPQKDFDKNLKRWLKILAMNLKKEKYFKVTGMKTNLNVEHDDRVCRVELQAEPDRRKRRRLH